MYFASMNSPVRRAMVIDDDQVYSMMMRKLIAMHQLCSVVDYYRNGREAMNHMEKIRSDSDLAPDVILLDLNMPVMDGWQFLEQFTPMVAELDKPVRIYLVSSSIDPTDIERARGIDSVADYKIKPVSVDELRVMFGLAA